MPGSAPIWFLTHAEVEQDRAVPVTDWPLSDIGRQRHEAFNAALLAAGIATVFASPERKARDAAAIHGAALCLEPQFHPDLHENDRSSTGYLPPAEFETVADAFFARPDASIRGWETSRAAQARIVEAVRACDAAGAPGNLLIVAHGAVGALLLCHALGEPISRRHDQPGGGGGHVLRFRRGDLSLLSGWERIGAQGR